MAMYNSNRFHHIKCKQLIRRGSPEVYQLTPPKETIGTLTRITLGERNVKETNKTILLLGETGSGKSTLINALVNYAMGVRWEDDVWFKIVDEKGNRQSETEEEDKSQSGSEEEEEEESQCVSQTSDVIVYQICGFQDKTLPFSLTIIDTPGYGDTRGAKQDEKVSKSLLDLFRSEDGVHEINVVGLVLKAAENRLSDRFRYVLDSVMSLFGKDMEENIVSLITFSDGTKPKNALKTLKTAQIKCAKGEKDQPIHFLFNNCQNEKRGERKEALENAYKTTMTGLRQFGEFLEKKSPQMLEGTVTVLKDRITLEACIKNLKERIEFIEPKQREIQQVQEALRRHEQEKKKNENFYETFDEPYKERENFNGRRQGDYFEGVICCLVCEENCHDPCERVSKPGSCKVMKRGHCAVCTNKCPVSAHVKEQWRYVIKTRKVQRTLQDVKKWFDMSQAECEKTASQLETLQKKMNKLQEEKHRWLEDAYQHILSLEQIALNTKSLSTHIHLDFLIEKMKEKGEAEKVRRLEEIQKREDEGTRAGLSYMLGRARAAAGKVVKEIGQLRM
ncbi:uncharacterized protein LOC121525696 [Cheilinus undulatus]|uniref:uncharacterized protein LOC121525696 n=1 Tax=Cheilinus undulatus TaxID=241271 RepID=UPI001BD302B5|nr:uncharacterized protein LOC121525696 [Cheilinus undulatus]